MSAPVRLRVHQVRQYVRNVHTRLPFRYGAATLTHVPVVHLRTLVEDATGRRAEGWSADCLPPGWFDKRPGRGLRDDVDSLRYVLDAAVEVYTSAGEGTAFELWHEAYHEVRARGFARGENGLTCGFGPALVDRSVIDAVGKLAGTEFALTVRENLLGVELGELHRELAGSSPGDWLPPAPRESIAVRQTVGLLDPLTAADLGPAERLDDGLPQTLEEYLVERGISHLKIKVNGDLERDLERIGTVASLLDRYCPRGYLVSLDGNEQYASPAELATLWEALAARPALARFVGAIEFIEQPLARQVALDPEAAVGLAEISTRVPVVIDESDDGLEAFPRAIELGYRGISIKNCKGVVKALANNALARLHNRRRPGYTLTCEDLMNTALVPVQQDLCTAATLGLSHVERNGHHYVRGLSHLSPREVASSLRVHGTLYEPLGEDGGQMALHDGRLDLSSLSVIGYGVGVEPDWDFLTAIEQWHFEDLGMPV